jgi:hypothetical protein
MAEEGPLGTGTPMDPVRQAQCMRSASEMGTRHTVGTHAGPHKQPPWVQGRQSLEHDAPVPPPATCYPRPIMTLRSQHGPSSSNAGPRMLVAADAAYMAWAPSPGPSVGAAPGPSPTPAPKPGPGTASRAPSTPRASAKSKGRTGSLLNWAGARFMTGPAGNLLKSSPVTLEGSVTAASMYLVPKTHQT